MIVLLPVFLSLKGDFKSIQMENERVETAYREKFEKMRMLAHDQGIEINRIQIFMRVFKLDKKLEIWAKNRCDKEYKLLVTYDICRLSGWAGPKRKEGDFQVPEGIYRINHFNPESRFYLSLGINYPNESDKILSDKDTPGGAIYIHGSCATIGCLPITDNKIKELYVLGVEAKNNGQNHIPVHIFPTPLNDENMQKLSEDYDEDFLSKIRSPHTTEEIKAFWLNLKEFYDWFETTKTLPGYSVDSDGRYVTE